MGIIFYMCTVIHIYIYIYSEVARPPITDVIGGLGSSHTNM